MRNKSALLSLFMMAMTLLLAETVTTRAQEQSSIDAPLPEQLYVIGKVALPGAIPFEQSITLTQAVAMAGGVLSDGGRDRVRIYRNTAEKMTRMVIIVDLRAIEKRRAKAVSLQPYDVVEIVDNKLSKQLKKECPSPLCLKVEPLPKFLPIRILQ